MKKDNIQLKRVYEKPITIFSKPVRVKKLMLIAIVGMLLGITGYLEIKAILWIIFGILNAGLFIFSFILQEKTILYFGEKSLEVSASGDLFITKFEGSCTKCKGQLKIVKKDSKSFIVCQSDNSHIWETNKV